MTPPGRIAVAMSGGVDSSVAAARLVDQGEQVFGVMMRLWVEPGSSNRCCSPSDVAAARRVADLLGIPFYVLDMQAAFHSAVVQFFLDGYAQGTTPNPCIECNRVIRWTNLLGEAVALGADKLATGHYARIERRGNRLELRRGVDPRKDQSYVLSVLDQQRLQQAVFPLGRMTKDEVRAYARQRRLPVAERSESQDLCFLGGDDYRDFLSRHVPGVRKAGPIIHLDGRTLGTHQGLANYTVGQRKGIGVPDSEPLFVVHKDLASRTLTVGPRQALGRNSFATVSTHWISGNAPEAGLALQVQVRYRAPVVDCQIAHRPDGGTDVFLSNPLATVSPGQSAVFYHDDVCLGGGVIAP